MAYMKPGSPFLYDETTGDIVGVKDADGSDSFFGRLATDSADNTSLAGNGSTPFYITSRSYFDVRAHGAKCDGVELLDGAMASGSNLLNSASGPFKPGDVGKIFSVNPQTESRTQMKAGSILQYNSPTQVVASFTATSAVSSGQLIFGTNDTAAVNAAVTYARANGGGEVYIPGICCTNGAISVPNGVALIGNSTCRPPNALGNFKHAGSSLVLMAWLNTTPFVTLGVNDGSSNMGAYIRGLTVDSMDLAKSVSMAGFGCEIESSAILGSGSGNNVCSTAGSATVFDSYFVGNALGLNVLSVGGDNKIINCQVYGVGSARAAITVTTGGTVVSGCHVYAGTGTYALRDGGIRVEPATRQGAIIIANNMIDSPYGPGIKLNLYNAGSVLEGVSVTGNTCYTNDLTPSNVSSFIEIDGAVGSKMQGVTFVGNSARKSWLSTTNGYLANLVDMSGYAGTSEAVVFMANVGAGIVNDIYAGGVTPTGVISGNNSILKTSGVVITG